jgi:hypothetical protein
MLKTTLVAVLMATSALVAAPAGAADLRVSSPATTSVHIAVVGKSADQLAIEIKLAATTVCTDRDGLDGGCYTQAVADANDQLDSINQSHRSLASANLNVERDGPDTIHVSVKGKTAAQLDAEIASAARTVCSRDAGPDFAVCVDDATRDAKAQLRSLAQLEPNHSFATN